MTAPTPADVPGQGEVALSEAERAEIGMYLAAKTDYHERGMRVIERIIAARLAERDAEVARRAADAALKPFRDLFAGGPDTVGRTTWREHPPYGCHDTTECVEVPLDDVRVAFEQAENEAGLRHATEPRP